MADSDRATFPVFAVLMLLLLLAAIAFGIMMFTSDRQTVADDEQPSQATGAQAEVDTLAGRLAVAEYAYNPARGEISGSVMNGTDRHYVNVQVEFVYFDLEGERAGSVRDTTRELAAGETWRFNIRVDEPGGVSRVTPGAVSGAERETAGSEASVSAQPDGAGG